MLKELEQRCFIGDVADAAGTTREVKLTFDEYVYEDDSTECVNEEFELDGEFVSYNDLLPLFGRKRLDAFITEAQQSAR